jgi:hypothetical protein
LKLDPGDNAGQAHAADGGRKPVGVFLAGTATAGTIGANKLEGPHMPAEGTGAVVVLPMDVIGQGAAQCHKASAGQNGHKPALRYDEVQNLGQKNPRLGPKNSHLRLPEEYVPRVTHGNQHAIMRQAAVAITATVAIGEIRLVRWLDVLSRLR